MEEPVLSLILFSAATLLPLSPARAAGGPPPPERKVLFRIGKTDGDTRDLALGPGDIGKYRFPGYFVPGWSDPRRDWPYVHPGPIDPFGHKPFSTFTIAFALSALPPSGKCRLVIDVADSQDKFPPVLLVKVNGKPFRIELPKGHGEPTLSGHPELGRRGSYPVVFPVTLLRRGANEITLTSVKGCWFLYDALRLETPPGAELAPLTRTFVHDLYAPPALVRREGKLRQVITAWVRRLGPPAPCRFLLEREVLAEIPLKTGWNRLEIAVPETESPRRARVELRIRGRKVASGEVDLRPVPRWTILLIPHSHVDIGYTDRQDKVERKHHRFLEQAMDLAEKTCGLPEGAPFRWDCESSWGVDTWFASADEKQRERFLRALRRGELEVGALFANELTGICSREELFRMTEWIRRFRKEQGLRLDTALVTDVPGWTWGIVPALARCGVRYLSCGPNRMARIGYTLARWGDRPFWWVSPSGEEEILCWVAGQGYSWFHHDGSLRTDKTFHYLRDLQDRGYPYDLIQVRYTMGGDNGPPNPDLPDQVRRWNERYAYPRYVLSTAGAALRLLEKRFGSRLPRVRGDFTPYWEDGAASTARETARNREAKERLVQAAALWAMERPRAFPAEKFRLAWRKVLLFDEHTWGAWCSVSQPDSPLTRDQWAWKERVGRDAARLAAELEKQALTGEDPGPEGPWDRVEVRNPASFSWSGPVRIPPGKAGSRRGVLDFRGKPLPAQRLRDGSILFLPGPIPPLASRIYTLVEKPTPWKGPAARARGRVLANDKIRVEVDPASGALASVRWRGRELVDRSKGSGWNDYLYVAGTDPAGARRPGKVRIEVEDAGPLAASLVIRSAAPGCRSLVRRVRILAGSPAVEIEDILDKEKVRSKEGVHIAFPFAVPKGVLRINIPWAVIRPGRDQLEGACRNFYCVERWADVSNQEFGLTWVTRDAPLLEVGRITAERPWMKRIRPSPRIFSYVMNNYWDTNFKADQEGPARFRYLVVPHGPWDPVLAEKTALSWVRPAPAGPAGPAARPKPSLFSLPAALVASRLEPLPDGKGLFLRLFNAGPDPAPLRISWKALRPAAVFLAGPDGERRAPLEENAFVPGWGIRALRVEFRP